MLRLLVVPQTRQRICIADARLGRLQVGWHQESYGGQPKSLELLHVQGASCMQQSANFNQAGDVHPGCGLLSVWLPRCHVDCTASDWLLQRQVRGVPAYGQICTPAGAASRCACSFNQHYMLLCVCMTSFHHPVVCVCFTALYSYPHLYTCLAWLSKPPAFKSGPATLPFHA